MTYRPARFARCVAFYYFREEPLGFVSCLVKYEIDGIMRPYFPATPWSPAEGGDTEIVKVYKIHPITGDKRLLLRCEWPFSVAEMDHVQELFAKTLLQDAYDGYEDSA